MLARKPAAAAPELEIKFQLGNGALEALQAELFPFDEARVARMSATYFDTAGHVLRDGGFSLRVRRSNEDFVQTLKHRNGGGLFERDEWEVSIEGPGLDLAALEGTPAQATIGKAALAPAFTVEVERRVHIRVRGTAQIEVSFDTGLIAAGDRSEPVAEMELELLSGPPQALFDLARELQATADLTLSFESKAERGYRLVGHGGVAAFKAHNSKVGPKTPGAQAFQLIARDALIQIAGNARLLQRAHNPDVLHQLRVGLRRFRAALSVFRDMLDAEGLDAAKTETRWFAGELSEARDIYVFLHRVSSEDEIGDSASRTALFRALHNAQAEAY